MGVSHVHLCLFAEKVQVFVLIISSHGREGVVFGSDGVPVNIANIIDLFKPDECKFLIGKPKIFLINACQGHDKELGN